MCGILGAAGVAVSPRAASRALALLGHRGPDGSGDARFTPAGSPLWLGHVRLAILDLSPAGAQPMTSRDGRWSLTYNGEVYNHLDLRRQLDGPWRGNSDTETLVEALAAWGITRTLAQLNGMYAFAALDHRNHELHLVRDPFGIKPLYFAQPEGGLVFASEMRGLHALAPLPRRVDPEALQTWLTLRYVPSPHTLLAGIQRVKPGHRLTWSMQHKTLTQHCDITPRAGNEFKGSLDDAAEAYRAQLSQAVKRQLLSDVPVGLLLSGGIDSALIAASACALGHRLPSYTVGYGGGQAECEINAASETAQVLGLPHHAIMVGPDLLWDALKPAVAAIEEPLGTTSVLPMWHLTQRAREDVPVVLAGQGSDEPWGGYRRYQIEVLREAIPGLSALRHVGGLLKDSGLPDHILRGLHSLALADLPERFVAAYELFTPEQRALLSGSEHNGQALQATRDWLAWVGDTAREPAMKMMHIDSHLNLADDLLLYGDKVSMAFSQEARVPMLDLDLMRFVESLPLKYRVRSRCGKVALRQAAKKILPRALIERPKLGFQMPFAHWLRTIWRERVTALLLTPGAPHLRYLNRAEIARCLELHVLHGRDLGRQLFALLVFAVWCAQTELA